MIRAKLERSTKFIEMDGKYYCSYCGKELSADATLDHHENTLYFHCDCEDAVKQMEVEDKMKEVSTRFRLELIELESQLPKEKYGKVTKTLIEKI